MYFIILVGMPGSGKSYLHQKIKEFFNIKPVDIVIDNIVQRDKTYISAVKKILKTCKGNCIKTPSLNTYKNFADAYWYTRKNGCGKPICSDASGCDCYNDTLLKKAIEKRKDIMFESALTMPLDWLFKLIPPDYEIVFFVNLINLKSIQTRINIRVKCEIKNKIAPRLPQSDKKYLVKRKLGLYKNLLGLLNRKDRMILYDNIHQDVIYDGKPKPELKKIIYSFK